MSTLLELPSHTEVMYGNQAWTYLGIYGGQAMLARLAHGEEVMVDPKLKLSTDVPREPSR